MKQLRKIFNIVSAAVLLTSFYPLLLWNRLEGVRIPTRFGMDGMPDRWGDMTSLLILCVIASAAYVFFLACQRAPQLMNTLEPEPAKITPGVSSAVKDFISHLCLVCMLLHSRTGGRSRKGAGHAVLDLRSDPRSHCDSGSRSDCPRDRCGGCSTKGVTLSGKCVNGLVGIGKAVLLSRIVVYM